MPTKQNLVYNEYQSCHEIDEKSKLSAFCKLAIWYTNLLRYASAVVLVVATYSMTVKKDFCLDKIQFQHYLSSFHSNCSQKM